MPYKTIRKRKVARNYKAKLYKQPLNRQIQQQIQKTAEKKYYAVNNVSILVDNTDRLHTLDMNVPQGTDLGNRIGREVFVRTLKVKIAMTWSNNNAIRIVWWQNKDDTKGTVTAPVVALINNIITLNKLQDIIILKDEYFVEDNNMDILQRDYTFNIYQKWKYNSASATTPVVAKGNIQMLLLGNSAIGDGMTISH